MTVETLSILIVIGLGENWFGFGFGKYPLKISNFSIFFPPGQKNLFWLSQKVPGPLICCRSKVCLGWVRARDGPWPDPTLAYFWPAVNKGQPAFDLGTFWPNPNRFFWPKRKKIENLIFLGEIFQIQTQTINGWHDPSHKKLIRPDLGQKILTQTHHWSGPISPYSVILQNWFPP